MISIIYIARLKRSSTQANLQFKEAKLSERKGDIFYQNEPLKQQEYV